jgi:hypothetical protein
MLNTYLPYAKEPMERIPVFFPQGKNSTDGAAAGNRITGNPAPRYYTANTAAAA